MKNHYIFRTWILTLKVIIIYLTGSQTTPYYQIKGLFGVEKRDLMADSVRGINDSLYDASDEFQGAAVEANSILNIGSTEEKYTQLLDVYEDCKSEVDCVKGRVQTMKEMSGEFFKEWRTEITQISNEALRNDSQKKYDQTYQKYTNYLESMKKTEADLNSSLGLLYDQVMSLKHKTGPESSQSLKAEAAKIENDIDILVKKLKEATKKTDDFVSSIN